MLENALPPSRRAPCPPPRGNPRWSLAVAILGSSMAFIDGTVVNVALPVMQRELGVGIGAMQWVVEAYALFLAALVLVGGALGDRFGRRRVFLLGVVGFALASAACGAAPNASALIAARAVQGVAAAALVPGSLALVSAAYPDERARGAAIGTWSAATSVVSAVGPVAGGWIAGHASWRWLFYLNVPLGVVVLAMTAARVGESRDEEAAGGIDVLGALLVTIGLGAIVLALVGSDASGGVLGSRSAVGLGVGAAALALFVGVEARRRSPMLPLALFRSRTFAGTNALTLLLYAALGGGLFFVPFNLIQLQGYTPAEAGAALLPLIVLIAALSGPAGALAGRVGARPLLVVGPLVAAAAFALLAVPSRGGPYATTFLPGVVVLGIGMGITVAPLTAAVMGSVTPQHAGVASGVNNAVSRAAGLVAIAALGVLLRVRFDAALDDALASMTLPPGAAELARSERAKMIAAELPTTIAPATRQALRAAFEDAYVAGFRALMIGCAALSALGAVAAFVSVEPRPRESGSRSA